MCRFWLRREKCNHHFPELNKKTNFFLNIGKFFSSYNLLFFSLIAIVAVGWMYLTKTNSEATRGYQIKNLKEQVEELKGENKRLNLEYIEMQSIANIIEKASNLNLVAISDMEVIKAGSSSVAMR